MKILFCNYEYPPIGGGGGVINALLAEELAKRHEVSVLTSRAFDLPAEEVRGGVRVLRVPVLFRRQLAAANVPSLLAYVAQGIRLGRGLVQQAPPDLINTHFALPSGPVGDALARAVGCPNVLSLHGGDLYDPSKWTSPHRHALLRLWIRRLMRRADRLVGQSSNTIENAHRYFDREVEVACIPLGIRRPPEVAASREALGLREDAVLLVTVGRLVGRKAVDQLIELLPELPSPVQLVVVGSGPKQAEWQTLAARLGLGERVRFTGQVGEADKIRFLRAADLYVSTSQHEGFGLVFLEAMACGLPVVCYDHGGQTDFLADGSTGRLVPLADRAAFLAALRELVAAPDRRRAIAAHNRKRVEAFFIEHCARRYEELFEEVLAHRKAQAEVSLERPLAV